MYGLMYRDLVVNKKTLLIFFSTAIWVHVLEIGAGDDHIFLAFLMNVMSVCTAFFVIGAAENTIIETDMNKRWTYYVSATSDGARNFVGAKYLLTLGMTMTVTMICIVLNAFFIDVFKNAMSVTALCSVMFFFQLFLRALDIPFIMAFGKKGTNIKGLVMLVLVMIVVSYLLFGDLEAIGLTDMDSFWEKFLSLMDTENSPKITLALSIFGICSAVLYYVSYRVSCVLFSKGAEKYE